MAGTVGRGGAGGPSEGRGQAGGPRAVQRSHLRLPLPTEGLSPRKGLIKVKGAMGNPTCLPPFSSHPRWGSLSLHQGSDVAWPLLVKPMDPISECFKMYNIHRITKESRYIEVWLDQYEKPSKANF